MTDRIGAGTRSRIAGAWTDLLGRIAAGDPIRQAIESLGFSVGEIRAYRASTAGADAEWARAKEESADAYCDEIRARITDPDKRVSDPALARVELDALKWLAARRNPRVYSDRATLDVHVKSVDLTRIIEAANARLAAARSPTVGRIIEGELAVPALVDIL